MAFTLRPAGPDDAEDITRIFQDAFRDDHIMGRFHPRTPKEVVWEADLKMFGAMLEQQGEAWGGVWTKVVDGETGKTVAFSKWDHPYTLSEEQRRKKEERDAANKKPPVAEGSNGPLMDEFFRQLFDGRRKWIVRERMFFLHILAVDPAYQRRGLGSMLIRPGLEAADKAGMQTYIEASPSGLPLYMKHGWEPVDEMVIDMGKYGEQGIEVQKLLMREANAPRKLGKKAD